MEKERKLESSREHEEELEGILKKYGKELSKIEEAEPEPSLGNGGLGLPWHL